MLKKDPRVDAYIARSADFAKPILKHLRRLVHAGCPDVEETMKWGFPHFMHKGILCNMGAFKAHCTFGFWKRKLIFDAGKSGIEEAAHGQFGRLTALADLPNERTLSGCIKKAVELNEAGIKKPPPTRMKKELVVPDFFASALKTNKKALAAFESFSPSHKREYLEWITEAKREETRARRLQTALAWLAKGKSRNWKYENC